MLTTCEQPVNKSVFTKVIHMLFTELFTMTSPGKPVFMRKFCSYSHIHIPYYYYIYKFIVVIVGVIHIAKNAGS